jgi:hypothetical protein
MSLLRRLSDLFVRRKLDQEIDAELRSHLEMRIEDDIAAGMSKEEAYRDAMVRFGSRALMKERVTSADAALIIDGVARDTRYAIRRSFRSPAVLLPAPPQGWWWAC